MYIRDAVANDLEETRDGFLHAAVLPFLPLGNRHRRFGIRQERIDQHRDIFRPILQVAIHEHDQLLGRQRQACRDRVLLSEITTEPCDTQVLAVLTLLVHDRP